MLGSFNHSCPRSSINSFCSTVAASACVCVCLLPNLQAAEFGSQLRSDAILRQSRFTIWIKATSRIWNLLTKQPWTKTGTCALSTDGVRGDRREIQEWMSTVCVCRVGIKCQIFHRTPFWGGGHSKYNTYPRKWSYGTFINGNFSYLAKIPHILNYQR